MHPVQFRDAEPGDYPHFARLFPELAVDDPIADRAHWQRTLCPSMFVAQQGDEVVGYGLVSVLRDTGYVRQLVVDPSHRGRGLGRRLMQEAARRFALGGCCRWCLNVKPDNLPAIRLYQSLGMRHAYASVALRVDWDIAERLPSPDPELLVSEPPAALDEAIEAALGLVAGQLAMARDNPRVVVRAVELAGRSTGVAAFDPGFPGCFPFRAQSAAHARALLTALRPLADPGVDDLQVVCEDSPELVSALVAAGARVKLEFAHFRGSL